MSISVLNNFYYNQAVRSAVLRGLEMSIQITTLRNMLFPRLSHVNSKDLHQAKMTVLRCLNNREACLDFLIDHPKWVEALEINHADSMQSIQDRRAQALEELEESTGQYIAFQDEYEQIQDAYKKDLKELSTSAFRWERISG